VSPLTTPPGWDSIYPAGTIKFFWGEGFITLEVLHPFSWTCLKGKVKLLDGIQGAIICCGPPGPRTTASPQALEALHLARSGAIAAVILQRRAICMFYGYVRSIRSSLKLGNVRAPRSNSMGRAFSSLVNLFVLTPGSVIPRLHPRTFYGTGSSTTLVVLRAYPPARHARLNVLEQERIPLSATRV